MLREEIIKGFLEQGIEVAKEDNFEEILKEEILKLETIEQEILTKRFGINSDPQTLLSVAEQLGMEREEIRKIEYNAYKKLVNALKERK